MGQDSTFAPSKTSNFSQTSSLIVTLALSPSRGIFHRPARCLFMRVYIEPVFAGRHFPCTFSRHHVDTPRPPFRCVRPLVNTQSTSTPFPLSSSLACVISFSYPLISDPSSKSFHPSPFPHTPPSPKETQKLTKLNLASSASLKMTRCHPILPSM